MRKVTLILLLILALGVASIAFAQPGPPDSDPTCGRGNQERQDCAGDNGGEGCRGISRAEETPADETPAADAFDLVTDILGEGAENDCDPTNDQNG